MKAKLLFISLLIIGSTMGAYAQSDLFEKLSNEDNVTVVTITKTLLSLMSQQTAEQIDVNGMQISHLISKLDQLDIFTSEDASVKKMMRDGVNSITKNDKTYENVMNVKTESGSGESGSEVKFYMQKGKDNLIKSMIMFVNEDSECVLIRILGSFTLEDVKKITEGMN